MSSRGRFRNKGGWNQNKGGNRGFNRERQDFNEPPSELRELGVFIHPCQSQLIVKSNIEQVPYFNAPLYLENKTQIGKVDEIFGPIRDYSISVALTDSFKSSSFPPNQKIYICPSKLLPLQKFLPKPVENKIIKKVKGEANSHSQDKFKKSFGGHGGGHGKPMGRKGNQFRGGKGGGGFRGGKGVIQFGGRGGGGFKRRN